MLRKVGGIYRQNHSLNEGQQSTAEKILKSNKMAQYGSSNDYFKLINSYHTFPLRKTTRLLTLKFTKICFICLFFFEDAQ